MTASTLVASLYLAGLSRPVPATHDSGKGHLTVWSVVLSVIFLILVLGFQFYRRSRRK